MVGIGWISSLVGVGGVSSACLPSPNDLLRSTSAVLPNWVGQSQYRAMTGRYLAATSSGDDRDGRVLSPALVLIFVRSFIAVEAVEANGEMEWGRDFGMQSKNCVERPFLRMTHQDGGRGRGANCNARREVSARTMIRVYWQQPPPFPRHAREGGRVGGVTSS